MFTIVVVIQSHCLAFAGSELIIGRGRNYQANVRHWTNVGLILGQRRRHSMIGSMNCVCWVDMLLGLFQNLLLHTEVALVSCEKWCQLSPLTLWPPNYSIWISTHLKLCLADAIHNFKWVKIIQICLSVCLVEWRSTVFKYCSLM